MMGRFGCMDGELLAFKVDILPFQPKKLTGASQSAEPCHAEDQPPLCARTGVKDFLGLLGCHKVELGLVWADGHREVLAYEWVLLDDFCLNGCIEELPGHTDVPPGCVFAQLHDGLQISQKADRMLGGDGVDGVVGKEHIQLFLNILQPPPGAWLDIGSAFDIAGNERFYRPMLAMLNKVQFEQTLPQAVRKATQPFLR